MPCGVGLYEALEDQGRVGRPRPPPLMPHIAIKHGLRLCPWAYEVGLETADPYSLLQLFAGLPKLLAFKPLGFCVALAVGLEKNDIGPTYAHLYSV